tara:strand:+ start:594 stop:1313 length:720 start_codon:yes stop_codon:yes gene_type:complete
MNNKRRLFLKGALISSASGVLLTSSGLVQAAMQLNSEVGLTKQSDNKTPIVLFTNDAKVEASFGAGVKSALPSDIKFSTVRTSHIDVLTQFNQLLNKGESTRLIGMVDDATGELLVAQARHTGARVSWLGQHMSSVKKSRHQIINSNHTQDSLLSLGTQLKKSSNDFELESEQLFTTADKVKEFRKNTTISLSNDNRADQWATHLGYALAASKAKLNAEFIAESTECLEGQFFSFVIEV